MFDVKLQIYSFRKTPERKTTQLSLVGLSVQFSVSGETISFCHKCHLVKSIASFDIGKHLRDKHLLASGDLTENLSVLKKPTNKFDFLLYEMFFIQELRPALNVQSHSIRAKVFNQVFNCYLLINFYLFLNQLLIISSPCMFLSSVYTFKNYYTSYTSRYIYIFHFVFFFVHC